MRHLLANYFKISLFVLFFLLINNWLTTVFASEVEQQVKVSFIYNFAKFIKWPNSDTSTLPFYICTQGNKPLSKEISLLQNKQVGERNIIVRAIIDNTQWKECSILFIDDGESERVADILKKVADYSVLTISDSSDFLHKGGMIAMSVNDNHVRFAINLAQAQKAKLIIDSQLLQLAIEVLQ